MLKFLGGCFLIIIGAVTGHYGSKNLKAGLDTWNQQKKDD
jgi:hypothetical protein